MFRIWQSKIYICQISIHDPITPIVYSERGRKWNNFCVCFLACFLFSSSHYIQIDAAVAAIIAYAP